MPDPLPLDGIKIVDLSIALTGPYAVALLGDQGADVVKVERPGFGDIGRYDEGVGVAVGRNAQRRLSPACQHDPVPGAEQSSGDGAAQTRTGTGDHGHRVP